MWNSKRTDEYSGMIAETITIKGFNNDDIRAYYSRPLGKEPYGSIVLIPHMPGWDEWQREAARRFTDHGYAVVCPNIYQRFGDALPPEVSQKVRESGGVPDDSVLGDVKASMEFLRSQPLSNGKVGVIGMCSGGRHTFLAACCLDGVDAAVNCWGSAVSTGPAPAGSHCAFDFIDQLNCPVMGIFGNEDHWPSAEEVDEMERMLKEKGKDYVFHRYEDAGHGIWYYDKPMYRREQFLDSFAKVMEFFDKHLK